MALNPVADLIAAELPRHVDLILWSPYDESDQRFDTGGLACSCREWSAPRYEDTGLRPRAAFNRHVADAVHRRISTPEVREVLAAVLERTGLQRIGLSMHREMDRDIVTLRAAAAMLQYMLAPESDRG